MALGDLKITRFIKHSRTTRPSQAILDSHYNNRDEAYIIGQTGTADWFLAELIDPTTFGGKKGELYVIFNPTDSNGNALKTSSIAYPYAKLCSAPNPPFNSGESSRSVEELLEEVNSKLEQLFSKVESLV